MESREETDGVVVVHNAFYPFTIYLRYYIISDLVFLIVFNSPFGMAFFVFKFICDLVMCDGVMATFYFLYFLYFFVFFSKKFLSTALSSFLFLVPDM